MRWTPHMEESLQKLSDEPEWLGDQVLAFIVRIFKVLEDFSQVQWSVSEYGGRPSAPRPTSMYYVKALRANLDEIRRTLPSSLKDNSACYRVLFRYPPPFLLCNPYHLSITYVELRLD